MIMESSKQKNRYFHSLFISQRKVGKVLEKKYIYPYQSEINYAYNRLSSWEEFSKTNSYIGKFEVKDYFINRNGLNVVTHQEYFNQIPHQKGKVVLENLKELGNILRKAWDEGLVHGDLNRKNILLTKDGYRIIDIEPLLKIPLANGKFILRTTNQYLSKQDRINWTVSKASDQVGFNCFTSWIRGEVKHPAMAK